ncbi:MAG TPA: hypothetical protein VFW87_09915 [Pirellulales bacterium]|nr:hypothetical protein [Pirellulales bacterium]
MQKLKCKTAWKCLSELRLDALPMRAFPKEAVTPFANVMAALVRRFERNVRVLDPNGRLLGFIDPAPSEEIAQARERMKLDEPEFSTAEVLAYLRSLGAA